MALPVIGSVFQSIRMMGLSMKWQQRKADPTMPREGEDPQAAMLRKQASDTRKSNAIASIQTKLDSGGELTPEELEYLRINAPTLYEEAMQIKRERAQYKQQLANCKTREEADQLYINKMQGYLSAARTISSNPNLSAAEKKGQLERIARRMIGIQTEQKIFVKNGDYERLPSEQEIIDEKRAGAAEKSGELTGARESGREQDGERTQEGTDTAPECDGDRPQSGTGAEERPDAAVHTGRSAHELERALYRELGVSRPGDGSRIYDAKGVVRELDFTFKRTARKRP